MVRQGQGSLGQAVGTEANSEESLILQGWQFQEEPQGTGLGGLDRVGSYSDGPTVQGSP